MKAVTRHAKQVTNASKRLQKALERYNSLPTTVSKLQRTDVLNEDTTVWSPLSAGSDEGDIPARIKRKAIDALHLKMRADEELTHTTVDVARMYRAIENQRGLIIEKLNGLDNDRYSSGISLLLHVKLASLTQWEKKSGCLKQHNVLPNDSAEAVLQSDPVQCELTKMLEETNDVLSSDHDNELEFVFDDESQ